MKLRPWPRLGFGRLEWLCRSFNVFRTGAIIEASRQVEFAVIEAKFRAVASLLRADRR